MRDAPARAWQRMLSGKRLDLLNPQPDDIAIEDIAQGLSRVARWNGQTRGDHAFTVAQHVLIVEDIASALNPEWPKYWRLATLLHDAAEYVIGDLISPFKTAIGLDYKALELRLLSAIYARFGVPQPIPDSVAAAIKQADRIAAFYEATRLAGFSQDEAEIYFSHDEGLPEGLRAQLINIEARPAHATQEAFLARFALLSLAP